MMPLLLRQRLSLLGLCIIVIVATLYMNGFVPVIFLYIGLAGIFLCLALFVSPFALGMKDQVRGQYNQKVYEFMRNAGLNEKDMELLVSYSHKGYRIGFGPCKEYPHYQVNMTTRPFENGEMPTEADYVHWREALKIIGGTASAS